MLTSKDYRRDNWEHVTWQIVSGVYARGYVESTVIPPDDYLHWMMERYGLDSAESVRIDSGDRQGGKPAWRITIRQAREQEVKVKGRTPEVPE